MAVFCVRAKTRDTMGQPQGVPEKKGATCSAMKAWTDESLAGESRATKATDNLSTKQKKTVAALHTGIPSLASIRHHTASSHTQRPPSLPTYLKQ